MTKEEAIKEIKDWNLDNDKMEVLSVIIPELKESEDERIRAALIKLVEMVDKNPIGQIFGYGDIKYSDMIAWLEKHKEQKPNPYSGVGFAYNGHTWGMCARDNGVDILLDKQLFKHLDEKREEQTTDKIIERARTEKQRVLLTETNGDAHIDWDCRSLQDVKLLLKYGLEYIDAQLEKQGEKKPADEVKPKPVEWSNEDEKMLKSIFESLNDYAERSHPCLKNVVKDEIDWLKSLKDRVQPQSIQELSKEVVIEYVDLGLPSGTMWKLFIEDGYYTFDRAVEKFGSNLPTKEQ